MYSYPISPEELRIIWSNFRECAFSAEEWKIVDKYDGYFGYEKEDE